MPKDVQVSLGINLEKAGKNSEYYSELKKESLKVFS